MRPGEHPPAGGPGAAGSVPAARLSAAGCDSGGRATAFAFRTSDGDLASWPFSAPRGAAGEVPDATIRDVMGTVRALTPSAS
ncbi:hypothetical protein ACH4F6_27140 [Streptomyces sp. NPDC017936]|uniref:hypothetical protein n=1 Tax=Streptomyces sp. NPDC017936 TaxID=3365016 RepID=UPI003798DECE